MKTSVTTILGMTFLLAFLLANVLPANPANADEPLANAMCPVTPSEKVDPVIFTEYEGQRVYFCCQRCRRQFEASPEKYVANLTPSAVDAHDHTHGEHGTGHSEVADNETPQGEIHAPAGHGPSDSHQHDHSTDHAFEENPGFVGRLLAWLGRFHPVIIHFPIALLIAAALAEGLHAVKHSPGLRTAVYLMVYLGAASAIFAAFLGWLNAAYGSQPESMAQTLALHRWLGTATAVWSVALAWHAWGLEYGGSDRAFRINLTIAAILVCATGHFGGTLVFGEGYFAW